MRMYASHQNDTRSIRNTQCYLFYKEKNGNWTMLTKIFKRTSVVKCSLKTAIMKLILDNIRPRIILLPIKSQQTHLSSADEKKF